MRGGKAAAGHLSVDYSPQNFSRKAGFLSRSSPDAWSAGSGSAESVRSGMPEECPSLDGGLVEGRRQNRCRPRPPQHATSREPGTPDPAQHAEDWTLTGLTRLRSCEILSGGRPTMEALLPIGTCTGQANKRQDLAGSPSSLQSFISGRWPGVEAKAAPADGRSGTSYYMFEAQHRETKAVETFYAGETAAEGSSRADPGPAAALLQSAPERPRQRSRPGRRAWSSPEAGRGRKWSRAAPHGSESGAVPGDARLRLLAAHRASSRSVKRDPGNRDTAERHSPPIPCSIAEHDGGLYGLPFGR